MVRMVGIEPTKTQDFKSRRYAKIAYIRIKVVGKVGIEPTKTLDSKSSRYAKIAYLPKRGRQGGDRTHKNTSF